MLTSISAVLAKGIVTANVKPCFAILQLYSINSSRGATERAVVSFNIISTVFSLGRLNQHFL